jgi:hypothetical protein
MFLVAKRCQYREMTSVNYTNIPINTLGMNFMHIMIEGVHEDITLARADNEIAAKTLISLNEVADIFLK